MAVLVHEQKYRTGSPLIAMAAWPELRVEHRRLDGGYLDPVTCQSNELVFVLSGRTHTTRTGNQHAFIYPGIACICPVGTYESDMETRSPIECLHIYLPPTLIERSALADYDIDPAKVELAYAPAFGDPLLHQVSVEFHTILGRSDEPVDRLFVDGMQAMLAAHLLRGYTIDRWRPRPAISEFDYRRLKRVLDLIEARFAEDILLGDLAAEACLSPFHFSRLFRKATGLSPHAYGNNRRVREAKEKLKLGRSTLVEIALESGFGSQANFIRVFSKACGVTPGQYRAVHRS